MGEFEESVLAAVASIEALIPPEPAAELGRYQPRERRGPQHGTAAQQALDAFPGLAAERLLGALELGVAALPLHAPADVVAGLRPPGNGTFGFVSLGRESALRRPVAFVAAAHPGAIELVTDHVRSMTGLLDLSGASGDEAAIAAQHGAAHLALAVAVSAAVLRAVGTPTSTDPVAIIGIAIGVTALLLPSIGKPPAYARAMLEKRRAEYKGSYWQTNVPVFDHEFVFVEEPGFPGTDFSVTGLVSAVDTGFAVRTGVREGSVPVFVRVALDEPGEPMTSIWDEVAEVSFTAVKGDARLGRGALPPWPGEFRVRAHARGRDGDDEERHELLIWPAPHADPLVLKKTDRVGHRLRGEPEPAPRTAPEAALRWLPALLGDAATVTVVTGLGVDDVVGDFEEDSLAVEIDGGTVVLELDNWVGSGPEVLKRLSRNGSAASLFWNVNSDRRLSFARDGALLGSAEPWKDADYGDDPEVAAALAGLDFEDLRHLSAKGITAVVRFTRTELPREDLAAAVGNLFSSGEE
ncbi:DUF6461 domain-containing protein [Lentzea sp.]|uniref:DUF6461 domain-containing protein n=1 Tax=Lentzea sp. TaxID=56099 RepID=UPI002ED02737